LKKRVSSKVWDYYQYQMGFYREGKNAFCHDCLTFMGVNDVLITISFYKQFVVI